MRSIVAGFVVLLLTLNGCSETKSLNLPKGQLEGTITFKGKPVPHALVVVTDGKQSAQGFADAQGKFKVENCPSGAVKLGINTDAGRGNMMSAMMASKVGGQKSETPTFVDVPKKYFEPGNSGIETNLADPQGNNTFDVTLQ